MELNPIRIHYKEDIELNLPTIKQHVGISAKDLEEVIPDAVKIESDGYRVVSNGLIFWAMVNAIKELKAEVDILKTELTLPTGGGQNPAI